MTIEAIPTMLNGVEYKSRLEARWALFLTLSGVPFAYEPNGPDTLPDFKVIVTPPVFIEVKGQMPNKTYIKWLRQHGVQYLAIGGFFKGLKPLFLRIADGRLGETTLHAEPFSNTFPSYSAFIKACNYRFDL